MRIVAVSGSLQAASTNRALIELATKRAHDGTTVLTFDGLAAIPAFNSDLDPAPPAVIRWRELVGAADALLFATPEYAFGMPGALKNALDWLVGSGEIYGKRAAIVSAAPSI